MLTVARALGALWASFYEVLPRVDVFFSCSVVVPYFAECSRHLQRGWTGTPTPTHTDRLSCGTVNGSIVPTVDIFSTLIPTDGPSIPALFLAALTPGLYFNATLDCDCWDSR